LPTHYDISLISNRKTSVELSYLEGVASVTWKVYISMSLLHGAASGQPFASLPSRLYSSGIVKQVFITHSLCVKVRRNGKEGRKRQRRIKGMRKKQHCN